MTVHATADADILVRRASDIEEVFARYYVPCVRLAARLGADDPEDVAQDAFARLWPRVGRFDTVDDAGRYARAIVCNLTRSRWRRGQTLKRALRDASANAPVTGSTQDSAVALAAAVRMLPTRQREAIVLRYWEELTVDETACVMEVSPGSVKAHVHRGIRRLKSLLGDSDD